MTKRTHYATSWQLEPTTRQIDTIAKLRKEQGITAKDKPATRWEARLLIHKLR